MPTRRDLPCADCGQLMWRGPGSLPAGKARCQACRRKTGPKCIDCSTPVPHGRQRCRPCFDANRIATRKIYPDNRRRFVIDGVVWLDPRRTNAWRQLRDQVVLEEPLCALGLSSVCTTWSETADHIKPVSERPDLALVRSNLAGVCRACNQRRRSIPYPSLRLGWFTTGDTLARWARLGA